MVTVLQSIVNIMQFKALWLPKCKIVFLKQNYTTLRRCKGIIEKLAAIWQ